MFGTDQSHFRKYLATLGVAIAVASLSLGGYVLQLRGDLDVRASELAALTETARRVVAHRQTLLLVLTAAAPVFMVVGALLGVTLSVFGLRGWANHQSELDKRSRLETEKLSFEVDQMTPAEKVDKAQRDVREISEPAVVAPVEVVVRSSPPSAGGESAVETTTSASELYPRIERTVADKLKGSNGSIRWTPDLRITSPTGSRYFADVIGYRSDRIECVVEVKMLTNTKTLKAPVLNGIAHLVRLAEATGAKQATLLLVATDSASLERVPTDRIRDMLIGLRIAPRIVLMSWAELRTISPEELSDALASAAVAE